MKLVFKIVFDGGHDTHVLDVRGVLVAIFDAELPLRGRLDFAQTAVGVFGKLLSGGTGVLGGFFNHSGLDAVEAGVLVGGAARLVVASGEGDAVFHQFALTLHEAAHRVQTVGGDGDDAGGHVARGDVVVAAISVGFAIGDFGRVDADFVLPDAILREEAHNLCIFGRDVGIHLAGGVAQLFVGERPNHFVGFDLHFGQPFDGDSAIFVNEVVDGGVE